MAKNEEVHGSYVRKVRDETRSHVEAILAENDRLRVFVASLEAERQRVSERLSRAEDLHREAELLRGLVSNLDREKLRLHERLLSLTEELDQHRRERARLEQQMAEAQRESRRFSEQYVEVEAQNTNLANLYVASYRLHGTLDRKEVLGAIQEIVANLIGSEELAVYENTPDGNALQLVASFGIDPHTHERVPLGAGRIGRVAASGDPDVGPGPTPIDRPQEASLSACIPLKLDGNVIGALALFRLLPQKSGFEAVDHELFDLLATHAATALYSSGLQSRRLESAS